MAIRQTIRVVIIDDSKRERCQGGCGLDWSSAEAISLANERIKDRINRDVHLEYLDLSQPVTNHPALALSQEIKHKRSSLPLLVINGQPRISGPFDIRQLLDTIETEVELEHE